MPPPYVGSTCGKSAYGRNPLILYAVGKALFPSPVTFRGMVRISVRVRMRKLLRLLLAIVYITTTFTVLVGQTEEAGEQLGNARSSASPIQPQTDTHWATDPHFSHAKKTG